MFSWERQSPTSKITPLVSISFTTYSKPFNLLFTFSPFSIHIEYYYLPIGLPYLQWLSMFSPESQEPAQTVAHSYAKEDEKSSNKIEPLSIFLLNRISTELSRCFHGKDTHQLQRSYITNQKKLVRHNTDIQNGSKYNNWFCYPKFAMYA